MNISESNVSGNIVKEAYNLDQVINESFLSSNFNFNYILSSDHKDIVIKTLKKHKLNKYKLDWDLSTQSIFFEGTLNEDIFIIIDSSNQLNKCTVYIFTKTLKDMELLYTEIYEAAVKNFLKEESVTISYTEISLAKNQLNEEEIILKENAFSDISELYYPYIDMNKFTTEFFTRQENILILNGPTGVGKTKFAALLLNYSIKHFDLLNKVNKTINDIEENFEEEFEESYKEIKVAYIKNEDILSMDNLWTILKNKQFDFVILDDLDYMLLPRTKEVNSEIDINRSKFISQLLSFTDGIIPSTTKFIITSNKTNEDVDPALLREGRMFAILQFRNLSYKESLNILKNQTKNKKIIKSFKKEFKGKNEISPSKLGSFIFQLKFKKDRENFLEENNINLTEEAKENQDKAYGFEL
jgi:SpoVK/Ycf46/Vps4 family AAA+-type ATPase